MEKNKKFKLFAPDPNKPDALAEDTTPTLKFFFKQLWRKAGKLLTLNLLMIFQVLPFIIIIPVYVFSEKTPVADSPLYAPLLGAHLTGNSPTADLLLGQFGVPIDVPNPGNFKLILIAVLLLFFIVTWGWQNVGAVYNLRSMVRGDSCFLWSDYFYAIRKNLKQGLLFGLLDLLILGVLIADLVLTSGIISGVIMALLVIYLVMRAYIYPMMITFDLSIFKLLKNALIFTALGLKRNIVAILGVILLAAVHVAVIIGSISIGFSVPLILPFFYLLPLLGFISVYAAYPVIKRYMIDPYEPKEEKEVETTPQEAD